MIVTGFLKIVRIVFEGLLGLKICSDKCGACVPEKMHVQSTQFFHTLYVKGRLATFIKSEHCLPIKPDFFIVVMKIRICHVIVWAKFWNIGLTN